MKTDCANAFVDYVTADKTELFNVEWESNIIQLTESPVISVTSVEERADYSSDYTVLVSGDYEYYVDLDTDTIYRTTSSGYIDWAKGPGAVKVLYKAGYVDIPEDLKLALIDLVTYYWKSEYKENKHIMSATISNVVTSSQWRSIGFPDHITRVLELYKQIQI
ncbi:MAG: hypothetical protein JRJ85_25145 [Deltaproteobacteria bacterium]|nr:hypothetical protein [Deltaproteobacteria bacterium]